MPDKHIGVADLKRHLPEVMDEIARTKCRVIVERRGRPMVAIVPLDKVDRRTPGQRLAEKAGFGGEVGDEFWEIMQGVIAQRHERMPRPLPEDRE